MASKAVQPAAMPSLEESHGRVNLQRLLARKALLPAELEAPKARICVTGAAGFIGSRIVARLLAAGHTVHATRRAAGDDEGAIAALQELPGASERLRWFEADLLEAGSFDAAAAGCRYLVHAAGVVSLSVPRRHAWPRVIEPALRGVENVLVAANRTPSVERVVFTSSLAAVSADFADRGPGHVYSEADWNVTYPREAGDAYFTAKAAAETLAWSIAGQQERWRLVAICPGTTYGPLLGNSPRAGSVPEIKKLMDGSSYPFVAPLGLATVDVDDVAAAHTLALALPHARGRYLLCERAALITEVAAMLREEYPAYWVPRIEVPFWAAVPILVPWVMSYRWVKRMWNKKAQVDCSRARRELGLELIPLQQTMKDLFDRLLELGILERVPAYSKAPLAVPLPHGAPGSKAEAVAGAVAAAAEAVLPHSREGKKEA